MYEHTFEVEEIDVRQPDGSLFTFSLTHGGLVEAEYYEGGWDITGVGVRTRMYDAKNRPIGDPQIHWLKSEGEDAFLYRAIAEHEARYLETVTPADVEAEKFDKANRERHMLMAQAKKEAAE